MILYKHNFIRNEIHHPADDDSVIVEVGKVVDLRARRIDGDLMGASGQVARGAGDSDGAAPVNSATEDQVKTIVLGDFQDGIAIRVADDLRRHVARRGVDLVGQIRIAIGGLHLGGLEIDTIDGKTQRQVGVDERIDGALVLGVTAVGAGDIGDRGGLGSNAGDIGEQRGDGVRRSPRWDGNLLSIAMIVDDGVVKHIAVEAAGKFEVSSAEAILAKL